MTEPSVLVSIIAAVLSSRSMVPRGLCDHSNDLILKCNTRLLCASPKMHTGYCSHNTTLSNDE